MQYTTNLGLNKPDPNDYADIAKINENMDKIDALVLMAVAAAGAYNPEESYAVGDYCTHGGKLHKCGTAIPDGEAWNAEHWTETTVAAELAEVRASLSNKVAQLGKLSPELFDNPTHPNGYFASVDDRESPMPNIPAAGHWRLLYLPYFAATEGWAAQIAVGAVENSGLCWRKARGPEWQAWEFAATTTPPEEYDLPLANGISDYATSVYHKNQFNEVSVRVSVSATNSIQNGATIATLPEGFRPAKSIDTDATGYVSGSSWFACRLVIQPSGAVQVYWGIGSSSATFIVGSFAPYLAVD